ncbi:hypothetical protein ABBQ32_007824 [Trebouxia sp. C0010 RCD-2024]
MGARRCLLLILLACTCLSVRSIAQNCSLSAPQKLAAMQLTNLFENGNFEFNYGYCENINDGRGVTAGFAGFTTANGDALDLVREYTAGYPQNRLAKYLPALILLGKTQSDSTALLTGFCKAWAAEAHNIPFQLAQQAQVDSVYYRPSQESADSLGLQYALSRAFLYDTIIQHGDGDDGDSLAAIVNRTNALQGGSPADGLDESIWLPAMIRERRHDQLHPENAATADQWIVSVERTDVFSQLAETQQWGLSGTIRFNTTNYPNESLITNTTASSSAMCGQNLTSSDSTSSGCSQSIAVSTLFAMLCLVCVVTAV